MLRKTVGTAVALLLALQVQNAFAQEWSANLGYNSEYIFRGIPQKSSSAFGGVDFGAGGFSAGVWSADVGDGLEVDLYSAYGFEVGDFGFSVGGTWYTYTDDFDDDYLELNLGASWKFLSFDAAIGKYDNFTGPTLNYQFYSMTASYEGFYGTVGMFADDFDGNYYEAGYGNNLTIKDVDIFDYAIAVIYSDSTLLNGDADTNLVFTITKNFSF
ncbi:MAG: TorF family putative porin [Lysobacterales bacterium]